MLAVGSTVGRDLPVPGRELDGIHQAMEYLPQSNRVSLGEEVPGQITATGRDVVIIGGGDTGADCLGTAIRQGATHPSPSWRSWPSRRSCGPTTSRGPPTR